VDYDRHIDRGGKIRDVDEFITAQRAADAYAARRRQIETLLARLKEEIGQHARYARKESMAWDQVGDLGHLKELLVEALAFLAQREPEDIMRELES